ncbi:MAG: TIGR01777 family oxidoreductase [Kofleriaceae bacterium]
MKVAITGATGFIGSRIVAALRARGDDVIAFTRDSSKAKLQGVRLVEASLETAGPWQAAIDGCDAIVNLAGEPIAGKRWDAQQKQRLRDSRIETTHHIVDAIRNAAVKPRVLVSASGADYYPFAIKTVGDFDSDDVTEIDPPGDGFLARLCKQWEAEAFAAEALGVRVVAMRTGIVLGDHGGALAKMETPFKLFAGGKIGDGKQWMSWIHLTDAVDAYVCAILKDEYRGPVNLVAGSVRNALFAKELGAALHRPSWLPVPKLALKVAVGEMAETLLNGRNVVPAKLRELGFAFKHPELAEALRATR